MDFREIWGTVRWWYNNNNNNKARRSLASVSYCCTVVTCCLHLYADHKVNVSTITDCFSVVQVKQSSHVCVCVRVCLFIRTITYYLDTYYLACWIILTFCSSGSKVKILVKVRCHRTKPQPSNSWDGRSWLKSRPELET